MLITRLTAVICLISTEAVSQQTCLPPLRPSVPTNEHLITEFEVEVRADFDTYFDEAQRYLHCLNRQHAQALSDIQEVLDEFNEIFSN